MRLLDLEPKRGSASAAERVVVDQPVFRADLFDQTNAPPGNLRAAHCHLGFEGIEPTDRVWDEAIQEDAVGWLATQLSDLRGLLERCGLDASGARWLEGDAAALKTAVPAIVATVEATWAEVRAD